jgi:translation elongation factor EF-Ts
MRKSQEKSLQDAPGPPPNVGGDEVRATMEQARQALEASRSEIERAERLLRETEEVADIPTKLDNNGGDGSTG